MGDEPFDSHSGINIVQELAKYKYEWENRESKFDDKKWLKYRAEYNEYWKDIMYGDLGHVGFGDAEEWSEELSLARIEIAIACEIRGRLKSFPYFFHNLENVKTNEIKAMLERYTRWLEQLQSNYDKGSFSSDLNNRVLIDQCLSYFKEAILEMNSALSRRELQHSSTPASWTRHSQKNKGKISRKMSKKVFIAHGHDEAKMWELKNFLLKLGLIPIILHEQDDLGKTIVEKFEYYASQCVFAFVLLTPDDHVSEPNTLQSQWRARQNVIMELGWFMAKLGRERVVLLHKGYVEVPSDISGVIYLSFKESILETSEKIRQRLKGVSLI